MADLKSRFEAAVANSKNLSERPDNATLLKIYALFKQATAGDVEGKRPGFTDMVGRAKYDAWAEQFWTGAALDIEQVFTVGNDVRLSAPIKSRQPLSSSVVMCSASGSLTLVHMFEAARFVPIGNTPVTLEPVLADVGGVLTFGEPLRYTIGPSGILQFNRV